MGEESLRTFCDVIREFAQSIGKENFLLVGEIGGSREHAWEVVERTGLDAALGIEDVPGKLERMVTGYADPADYFSLFRNWVLEEPAGHRWYRNQVVTLVDDHDQVRKGGAKWRFCGDGRFRDLAFNVLAVQLTTMGIPCVYYGSEQGFDSGGRPGGSDLVLRENMFGGRFGGLCTQGRHFFNEDGDLYRALAALIDLRKKLLPLRRGRQVAAPRLRGRRPLRPAAPPGRADALAGVLVASAGRSGSPGRPEHRRGAARHGVLDGGADVPRRGGPVPPDLLVRPEARRRTPALVDRGAARRRAVGRPDDAAARRLRHLPGRPRPPPPGPQPAPRPEALATTPVSGGRLEERGGSAAPDEEIHHDRNNQTVVALTASDLMSRDVVTISQDTPLRAAAELFFQRQVGEAAVVDADGRCVGMLSATDLLRWALGEARGGAEDVPPPACPYQVKGRLLTGADAVICTRAQGSCPLQEVRPMTGGRHTAVCLLRERSCQRLAAGFRGRARRRGAART